MDARRRERQPPLLGLNQWVGMPWWKRKEIQAASNPRRAPPLSNSGSESEGYETTESEDYETAEFGLADGPGRPLSLDSFADFGIWVMRLMVG